MAQTSVKIDEELVRRIKRHVIDSRQTITEFIEDSVFKKLQTIEKRKLKWMQNTMKNRVSGNAM